MVFTVLGAVAELERGLIVERVKAGLHNARAKGKQLGRPKKSWTRSELLRGAPRASAGSESPLKWELESERSTASFWKVPKFGEGWLNLSYRH
jgi:hypothetical protein